MARSAHREPSRASSALRGFVAIVVLAFGAVAAIGGSQLFVGAPTVTSHVPASAGPIRSETSVEYRGVAVGQMTGLAPSASGAELTLQLDRDKIEQVPRGVSARVKPKTLFGDQIIELRDRAERSTSATLADGAQIPADTSDETAQLYRTYTRIHELMNTLRPAEFQVALSTLADALRGRGAELGSAIDTADSLSRRIDPQDTDRSLTEIAQLGQQLSRSAPDLLASVDHATELSKMVNRHDGDIRGLLSSGTELAGRSKELLAEDGQRAIRVLHQFRPVSQALAENPNGIRESLEGLEQFAREGSKTFRGGRFHIRAPVTLEDPYPYEPQDCPRYPGLDGPNCGPADPPPAAPVVHGGTSGPVGSPQERRALSELMPGLPLPPELAHPPPGAPSAVDPVRPDGPLGLLFGPVVRGTQVMAP